MSAETPQRQAEGVFTLTAPARQTEAILQEINLMETGELFI